jgi:hypothetical protein
MVGEKDFVGGVPHAASPKPIEQTRAAMPRRRERIEAHLARWRLLFSVFGADDRARTGDLNLGKVALYQLSYVREALPY